MKRLFLMLLAFILINTAGAQDKKYLAQCKQFIAATRTAPFILLEEISALQHECLEELRADTFYTKKEICFIEQSLKKPKLKKWTKAIVPQANIISFANLKEVLKVTTKTYHVFGVPIFLRGGNYCVFYNESRCGNQCGMGRMRLYQKWGDRWLIVRSYCKWIA